MPSSFDERPWRAELAVALGAACISLPGLFGEHTLDDVQAVLGHPAVAGAAPWWEVFSREFWGHPLGSGTWSSSYRPLTSLGFALEHRITAAPWLHHAVGIACYALLCARLTAFARRWLAPRAALVAGAVFAVLPVHVENVASIVGRADVLAAIFAIAAIERAVPRDDTPARARDGLLAAAWYLAALLCKESIALLPLLPAWLAFLAARRRGALGDRHAVLRHALAPALVAGVGLGYIVARQQVLAVDLPTEFVAADNLLVLRDGAMRAWGNFAVMGHYVELLLAPLRLCADHTYADIVPPRTLVELESLWALAGLLLTLVLVRDGVLAWRGRSPGLGFAALLALLLVGQWVIDLSVIVAERLALWPSVFLVLALVHAAAPSLAERPLAHARVLVGIVLALMSVRYVQRTLDWHDDVSLQRSSLAACPRAVHSRFILANALRRRGEVDESIWHYAVAGAGRTAFPERFESPLLDAELDQPLSQRLPQIPTLAGAADPFAYWAALHAYLVREGALAEAARVRELAGARP